MTALLDRIIALLDDNRSLCLDSTADAAVLASKLVPFVEAEVAAERDRWVGAAQALADSADEVADVELERERLPEELYAAGAQEVLNALLGDMGVGDVD